MRQPITSLDGKSFDVLIIGGGINGAGIAQQLAAAGFSTALVDKNDFGAATTSRSSRLLHCGMAYFAALSYVSGGGYRNYLQRAAGAVRAARRAMRGRAAFVRESPERLTPLDMYYVVYDEHRYKPWQLEMGFRLLEQFESKDVPLGYRRLSKEVLDHSPILGELRDRPRVRGVFQICEYQFNWPERICLDAILDAERNGAVVRNYTEVIDLAHDTPEGWTATIRDALTPDDLIHINARFVVNAGGPWINLVNNLHGRNVPRKVQPIRGSHIYLQLPHACRGQALVTFNHEGESIYCLPWGDGHYFGYTANPIQNGLDDLTAPDADIEQLVTQARELFPRLDITRKSLLGSWAGSLPATFDEQSPYGVIELRLHDMSRDGLPNMLAITAGNIMTHRQTAVAVRHEIERVVSPSGRGTGSISYRSRDGEPHEQAFNRQQMVDAARNEHVVNLDDLLFRRTGVAWLPSFGRDVARDAADVIAPEMGWDQKDIEVQLARFGATLETLRG